MTTHLSTRLVWHDRAWDGCVCDKPSKNAYCIVHKHIRDARDDRREDDAAGLPLLQLQGWRPPCSRDPLAFSTQGGVTVHTDPLERADLLPVSEEMPPYSVCPSPYLWMREDSFRILCEDEGLNIPGPKNPKKEKGWVSEPERQELLLKHFWGKLEKGRSLVFFYCKDGHPFSESMNRILVGVSRISDMGTQVYFGSKQNNPAERFPIWSRRVTHDYQNQGVRIPYQEYLRLGYDPSLIICPISESDSASFSFVAEHVSDDIAVGALERLLQSIQAVREENKVAGEWDRHLVWLNDILSEVWQNRGPFPGIGSVLQYLGCESGTSFQRQVLLPLLDKGENAWHYLLAILEGRRKCEQKQYTAALKQASDRWMAYKSPRRDLLSLLTRFELNPLQVERLANPDNRSKAGITATDEDLLANPYLISEMDQGDGDSELIALETIDRGMRPEGAAANFLEINETIAQDDPRRVRGVAVAVLQAAAQQGDTLLPFGETLTRITGRFPDRRACRPDRDLVEGQAIFYQKSLDFRLDRDPPTMALKWLSQLEQEVGSRMPRRTKSRNAPARTGWSWEALLLQEFGPSGTSKLPPEVEDRARKEKAEALTRLFENRFTVLTGRAGTGKTSVLKVFLKGLEALEGKRPILLLAPTGKARVRLIDRTKRDDGSVRDAYTIHQFLMRHKWLNPENFALKLQDGEQHGVPTVIIDEASMIPMDLLGVLFRALDLNKVTRLILVGDPNQLPPIGPGRPFVDIIAWLEADKDRRQCLGRLMERARHEDHNSQALLLADGYLENDTSPGDDDMLSRVARQDVGGDLEVRFWRDVTQLDEQLAASMSKHLNLSEEKAYIPFNASLGIGENPLKPEQAERWQILSPVRTHEHGTNEINRKIQKQYHGGLLQTASNRWNKIPQPFGEQEIVWTDKVMQVFNRSMKGWPQGTGLNYVANGEIGLVVRTFKGTDYDTLDVAYS
ncbi:MAG: AAA family ATPase, partial [Armatimonadota bacterium]|nr:AAA family ATPase [Armatimonadota bacterium]